MQNRGVNVQRQIWWQMHKGRYKGSLRKGSLGNCGWRKISWTTDLKKCKIADLVWGSKHSFGLVVRLKAIDHYERFLCYLSFLPLPSSLLTWLVSIITRFLFIGLVEVMRHRHSPWNPHDLISFNLFWSEGSLKTLYPSPVQIAPMSNRSRCHTQPLRKSDLLRPAGHPSRYA